MRKAKRSSRDDGFVQPLRRRLPNRAFTAYSGSFSRMLAKIALTHLTYGSTKQIEDMPRYADGPLDLASSANAQSGGSKDTKMMARCKTTLIAAISVLLSVGVTAAQEWKAPVRGSWVRTGAAQQGDISLAQCDLILAENAPSSVRQAATFLATDIEKLTGRKVALLTSPSEGHTPIYLLTLGDPRVPATAAVDQLRGQWEAHQILTDGAAVYLIGADARGTAFAAYTLSERLGIDPLYLWTGFVPARQERLTLAATNHLVPAPTIKYRGMFHDDEDILPRPFEPDSGYPMRIGDVPTEWYARFFETALRLRMNMVAPYTRVHRRYEVQKMASDWGLFYTSHHYDVLLSNPFGFNKFNLAEKRGVSGKWDWVSNQANMLKYWQGGVTENGGLNCIWPVGLRGTDDIGYSFPKDMPEAEQNKIFQDVIDAQRNLVKSSRAPERGAPVFHFTLYGEMLDKFLAGNIADFRMADDVILIWPDDNDGRMRALPTERGKWKHGVYYHLAYYGPVAKQSMHIVPPKRIANEFKKICDQGATEYALFNVSELREFVREARMIAEISWDAKTALADSPHLELSRELLPHVPTEAKKPLPPDVSSPSADRYVSWFCREYYGEAAAPEAARVYADYDELLARWDRQWWAGDKAVGAINSLVKRYTGKEFSPASPDTGKSLKELDAQYKLTFKRIESAKSKMNRQQRQFFFENCELPLLVTWSHTQAASLLVSAMEEKDPEKSWSLCEAAMAPLEVAEAAMARAERPPFDRWYAKTWIRHEWTGLNLHQPYEALRAFLASGGSESVQWPDSFRRPNLKQFLPFLKPDGGPGDPTSPSR